MNIQEQMRITYADCLEKCNVDGDEYQKSLSIRRLDWKSNTKITLEEAVKCYQVIDDGYNDFSVKLLEDLAEKFSNKGIMVTCAREGSVCIYLHIPEQIKHEVEVYCLRNMDASEVDWENDALRVWWDQITNTKLERETIMSERKLIGNIGVDAGLCWIGDPCYILHNRDGLPKDVGKNWSEFCDKIGDEDFHIFKTDLGRAGLGVCLGGFGGDGVFPVYATYRDGLIAKIEVDFAGICEE